MAIILAISVRGVKPLATIRFGALRGFSAAAPRRHPWLLAAAGSATFKACRNIA
jgi:hypothetical protein